jgi:hypothetical protein
VTALVDAVNDVFYRFLAVVMLLVYLGVVGQTPDAAAPSSAR